MSSNVYQMAFSDKTPTGEDWHPWHSDRQESHDGAFSYADAMKDTVLGGIHFKMEPVRYNGKPQLRKNWIIWEEKDEVMGFVRDGYQLVQPADLVGGFLDGMQMNHDAKIIHTAGILNDGRYWALIFVDDKDFIFNVGGSKMLTYLALYGHNDGKHACLAFTTTTRIECQNTMSAAKNIALLGDYPLVAFKHDTNVKQAIQNGAKMMGLVGPHNQRLRQAYELMAKTPLVGGAFKAFVDKMLPSAVEQHPDGKTGANVMTEREKVMRAYDDPKNFAPSWEGSWLHAQSAFADYLSHLRAETTRRGLTKSRFDSNMFGKGSEMLAMATDYCLAQVGFTPDYEA